MLIETLTEPFDRQERLLDFFDLTLPLRAKSVLFDASNVQPVAAGTEMKLLRYTCKEADQRNASIDYDSTDWIL